ncbi:hypothetical protein KSF_000090 [Reticulibacter mediterranei]|uniref:Uncharacterized protein n=1 Tax=Reticulibacter mediterranei TaxID=2778369 RepID=A0A8J3II14_9CHLR|nr:hypothetical protein [Reticulibacter mediterranei]GHO89961.1 hypothetical protein KSF_000090 [Reticulibacter mediterranei]
MAKREHVERIKRGVVQWNAWRKQLKDTNVDLSGEETTKHKGETMKTCHCGTCRWCEAKRKVLVLGERRNWDPFPISPCSSSAKEKPHWITFTETHPEEELWDVVWRDEQERQAVSA